MEDQIHIIRSQRNHPFHANSNLSQKQSGSSAVKACHSSSRERISEVVKMFRERRGEILRSKRVEDRVRVDLKAFGEIKQRVTIVNADYIGAAPGVRVGDLFEARAELVLTGVHSRLQNGIDFATFGRKPLATCVVSKIGYRDKTNHPDYIVYGGEGGNLRHNGGKKKKLVVLDQKMNKGNLALKNSMEAGNDVRVLRGVRDPTKRAGSVVYVYDGLYKVVDCRRKKGEARNTVFDFYLRRNPGQKTINWKNYKIKMKGKASSLDAKDAKYASLL